MRIFVPFTEIQTATRVALIGYDYTAVQLNDDYSYGDYFRQRWRSGESFINVEHDCVPWPGALEKLWNCTQPWCAFNYGLPIHREHPLFGGSAVPLGCTKISDRLIAVTPTLWDEPVEWSYCDQQLPKTQFTVHQHFPGIVNANPASLGEGN